MAGEKAALARASDSDQFVMAQPSRALLRPPHRQEDQARIYRSVAALRADITSFIDRHNADPKPSRWTKSADDILASIERFCRYNAPAKHDAMLRTSGSGH